MKIPAAENVALAPLTKPVPVMVTLTVTGRSPVAMSNGVGARLLPARRALLLSLVVAIL